MSPERQLESFLARFTPNIAALAKTALGTMRQRFPHALQLVYDNYNALVIGFGPTERASDAVFSVAIYPKTVNLCFLQAGKAAIRDPKKLLQGAGTTNRFIRLNWTTLDDPMVVDLMTQAVEAAKIPLSKTTSGRLIIKSISAKQRPRRPAEA